MKIKLWETSQRHLFATGGGPGVVAAVLSRWRQERRGAVDLHIHDADFVQWCFGDPQRISSGGRRGPSGAIDHVTTIFHYGPGGPEHVTAEGGFDHHPGFAFRMRYVAVFEQATADFDLARTPQLVLCREGRAEPIATDGPSGYEGQIRKLIDAIVSGNRAELPTLNEAMNVARLLDAERQSVISGRAVAMEGN